MFILFLFLEFIKYDFNCLFFVLLLKYYIIICININFMFYLCYIDMYYKDYYLISICFLLIVIDVRIK